MPNITGSVGGRQNEAINTGAFIERTGLSNNAQGGYAWCVAEVQFDASRCSAIYGNSSTVTPNSLITNFYIKY